MKRLLLPKSRHSALRVGGSLLLCYVLALASAIAQPTLQAVKVNATTGAITEPSIATTNFKSANDIADGSDTTGALALKAPLASPSFTGTLTHTGNAVTITTTTDQDVQIISGGTFNVSASDGATFPANTTIGDVMASEIGYLSGVTSGIQSQLNGKLGTTGDGSGLTNVNAATLQTYTPATLPVSTATTTALAGKINVTDIASTANLASGTSGKVIDASLANSTLWSRRWATNQQIICVGDSLTAGTTPPNVIPYPTALASTPCISGLGAVTNLGQPGEGFSTSPGVSSRYASEVKPLIQDSSKSYNTILLWIGANDYLTVSSPETYVAGLVSYANTARVDAPNTKVGILTILRRTDSATTYAQELTRNKINDLIRTSTGFDFLVDTDKMFQNPDDPTYFSFGGVHLNDVADTKLAAEISSKILAQTEQLGFHQNNIKSPKGWIYLDGSEGSTFSSPGSDLTLGTGDFTAALWVYQTQYQTGVDSNGASLIGGGTNSLSLALGSLGNIFAIKTGIANALGSYGKVPLSKWTHIAVTRSGSNIYCYIDGKLDTTQGGDSTDFSASSNEFGSRSSNSQRMKGYIADVVIAKRALSNTEVIDLMETGNVYDRTNVSVIIPTYRRSISGSMVDIASSHNVAVPLGSVLYSGDQPSVTINGVSFDGSANITVTAAADTLTGSTLASGVTAASLTSFGDSPTLTGNVKFGAPSGSGDDSALLITRSVTTPPATGSHAVRDESALNMSGGGLLAYASFDAIPVMSGSAAYEHLRGFQSRPNYAGSNTLSDLQVFQAQATLSGSGAVTNLTGVAIDNYIDSGTVALTGQVGLRIAALSGASSFNWGILVEGDNPSIFGGQIKTSGTHLATSVSTGSIVVNDKIGLGSDGNAYFFGNLSAAGYTSTGGYYTSPSGVDLNLATGGGGASLVLNGATKLASLTSNGFVKTSGGTGALSVDTTTYLSALPTSYTAVAAGTAYTLTGSFADVDLGTTDPTITISTAGNYLLTVDCSSALNAATTVAGQAVEIILRRTNNTAADIGTMRSQPLPASTLGTADGPSVSIASFPYTAGAGDIVTVQARLTGTLGAGTVTIENAHIVAVPR